MKTSYLIRFITAGVAGLALTLTARADVTVVISGGNASKTVLFDRAAAVLSGASVVNGPNSNVRSYVNGTITSQPGLGKVTVHFVLNGAVGGIQDLANQANEQVATTNSLPPQVAVSSTAPETVGIDPAPFTQNRTLVIPFAFIKNPATAPNLASVTNLTQRQAAYLEGAAGTLPSAFFGGASTNDTVYLVGRNTASAVRTITDASIYFTGTLATYTTNSAGQPILDPAGGQSSGAAVGALLKLIPNAIGTVAAQDVGSFTPLAYEGVPFSITNVVNGSYPIWGYERWLYLNKNQQGAPSANQLAVINALLGAVTDPVYQTTSTVFVGNFVPLGQLQVQRSSDGGPITSTIY